jgi:hypothetical protein
MYIDSANGTYPATLGLLIVFDRISIVSALIAVPFWRAG